MQLRIEKIANGFIVSIPTAEYETSEFAYYTVDAALEKVKAVFETKVEIKNGG